MKLAFILVLGFCNTASLQGSRLTVTLLALSLDASPLTVGALAALYFGLPLAAGLSIGRAIDRIGMLVPLLLCGVTVIVGNLLAFAFPQIWSLAVSASLVGLAFMATSISLNVLVPLLGPAAERTTNYTWFSLGSSMGMAAGPLIAGFGIEHLGHRTTFLLLVAVPIVALSMLAASRRLLPAVATHAASTTGRLRDVLRESAVRVPFLGSALAPIILELYFFVVPLFAAGIGIGASTIGIILGCCSGTAMGVRMLLPFLLSRMRAWSMVAATFAVTGLSFVLLPHTTSVPLLVLLSIVTGISTGASAPIVISLLYGTLRGRQAEVMGLRAVVASGGLVATPALVGGLSAVLGLAPVLAMVGTGVIMFAWLTHDHSRRHKQE